MALLQNSLMHFSVIHSQRVLLVRSTSEISCAAGLPSCPRISHTISVSYLRKCTGVLDFSIVVDPVKNLFLNSFRHRPCVPALVMNQPLSYPRRLFAVLKAFLTSVI